jgi:hypothetical protein
MTLKGSEDLTSQKTKVRWDGFGGSVIAEGVTWRRR